MRGRLIMVNVPMSDSEQSQAFYSHILGVDFARSLTEKKDSYHAPTSAGVLLTLNSRVHPQEAITAYFAVMNLDKELAALTRLGGNIVVQPTQLPVLASRRCKVAQEVIELPDDMGRFALVRDPENNLIGLIQLNSAAERFFPSHVTGQQLLEHHAGLLSAQQLMNEG